MYLPPSLPPSQSCLKAFYLSWVSSRDPLEPLVAELLARLHIPGPNCPSVQRPFGALKELVLPPLHEPSSLPYTSTDAFRLLRSIGEIEGHGWSGRGEGGRGNGPGGWSRLDWAFALRSHLHLHMLSLVILCE